MGCPWINAQSNPIDQVSPIINASLNPIYQGSTIVDDSLSDMNHTQIHNNACLNAIAAT